MPTLEKLMAAANVCDLLDTKRIDEIGSAALDAYTQDKGSRAKWEQMNARANELALQIMQPKSFPWQGASNVKFPLITVAAMQYQARAYPALVNGNDLVKAKVYGPDQRGERQSIADRISTHMTWQNLEQDEGWEEEHDKTLLVQSIAGCAFKKRAFDPSVGKQRTKLVLPDNLVVNYFARDLDSAPRFTEWFYLSPNDIRQRQIDGRFRKIEAFPSDNPQQLDPLKIAADTRQGLTPPPADDSTPIQCGEQYCWLDLDEDDYQEPYIVTFELATGRVFRIVARYLPSGVKNRNGQTFGTEGWDRDPNVYAIKPVGVYVKYPFIPSPDGGFYDLGLGALLGPINESVNTAINQVFDAATMATLGGGFLGRGFKAKSGPLTFAPGEWKPVDATGDDLRKSVLPLPTGQPPPILFQLLDFLVSYAERIVSANEIQVGENVGQNTPAETARTMDANGARVYAAIFKRSWRAMAKEFDLQAFLNKVFLRSDVDYEDVNVGPQALATHADYLATGIRVRPAADPFVVSDSQKQQQNATLVQAAQTMPGFNRYRTTLRWLKGMQVPNIEEIYPPPMQQGPNGQAVPANDFPPPPPDPKMIRAQVEQADQQLRQAEFMLAARQSALELQMDAEKTQAEILKLQAEVIKLTAEARSEETEPQIKLLYAAIQAQSDHRDRIVHLLEVLTKNMTPKEGNGTDGKRMAGMGVVPANASVLPAIAGTNPVAAAGMGPGTIQ